MSTDPLPPNNPTAEQGLLGCCIWDGRNVSRAYEAGIQPEAFFDLRNRELWRYLLEMDSTGDHISNVSLTQFSLQKGATDATSEALYVNGCMEQVTAPSNIAYHVRLVMEKWALRRVYVSVSSAASAVFDPTADPSAIIGRLEQQLADAKNIDTATTVSAKEATLAWIDSFERGQEERRAGKDYAGIPTGFRRLDRISSGLPVGGLTIIGARPSVGKTAMLCNIVQNACIANLVPTVVFSLETTFEKLYNRLASDFCNINATKIRDRDEQSEHEMCRMSAFAVKYSKSPLVFSKAVFTCNQICAMIARHAEMGFRLFLVDYVQIVDTPNRGKNEPKTYAVGSVATALKQAAIKHNVAVVALAQLKRTDDEEALPNSNDLADSDQLLRDADLLWLIHRPDRLEKPTEGCVVVAKNKDGETGLVPMTYTPYFLRWEERKENPHDT